MAVKHLDVVELTGTVVPQLIIGLPREKSVLVG